MEVKLLQCLSIFNADHFTSRFAWLNDNVSHNTYDISTMKPFLSDHLKIDKTKVLKSCGSLMQVKSTAECSMGAFCNNFDLH